MLACTLGASWGCAPPSTTVTWPWSSLPWCAAAVLLLPCCCPAAAAMLPMPFPCPTLLLQGYEVPFGASVETKTITAMAAQWGMGAAVGFFGMAIHALGGDIGHIHDDLLEHGCCLTTEPWVCMVPPVSCLLLPAAA